MSLSIQKTAFDFAAVHQDFPILAQKIRGQRLVYLDNAATSQKPRFVIDALARYYEQDNANIHRGVHLSSERATELHEGARAKIRAFLNAAEDKEIIFTRGTTEAINLVAQSYGRANVKAGDEIVVSAMEHHSNIVPWQMLCQQVGATLKVIPMTDAGELVFEDYEKLLNDRTRLVAVVHVSNALGTVNPVREIIIKAHAKGIPVLLDGAQAAPHAAVDVRALDCDFYALSGHKMCGPTGIGVLYGKRSFLEKMPPYQGGGDMIRMVSFAKTLYNDLPFKFEAGTPNIEGAVGLGAAIDYLTGIGMDRIAAYESELLAYATQALKMVPGLKIIGTAREKAGVISFVLGSLNDELVSRENVGGSGGARSDLPLDDIHPHDIGTILDQQGIAIRTGHHCAMPVMERLGISATARASLAFYNTREDIDALVKGLLEVKKGVRMNSELNQLYQEVILDHNKQPRNYHDMPEADHHAEGFNPLCGDRCTVFVKMDGDRIADVSFVGSGCAISKASTSIMTTAVKGKGADEIEGLFGKFHDMVTGKLTKAEAEGLGKLQVFMGVSEFPARVKCASLAWHTLKAALENAAEPVTTEEAKDGTSGA